MAKPTQKFLDENFLAKLSSKEGKTLTNPGEASFRVSYYGGGAGSVPFLWESQPGTPKHAFQDNTPPPLTPPPSHKISPKPMSSLTKKRSKNSKIFNYVFSSKKMSVSPSSSSSSSSFSSSYSLPSSPFMNTRKSYKGAIVGFGFEEDHGDGMRSPTSTLCFGPGSGRSLKRSPRRKFYYYPIRSVKKAVLAMVGHGKVN